ncbi:MAG: riboflavin biosynthesis protein RibF [Planctomycetota bacterium]|nr:riboflavin biosynthesis protein RibF [Planctomycetota bacterium]
MDIFLGQAHVPPVRGAVVTIGTFDGVHSGHQAVLKHLVEWAGASGAPAGVLTFGQHPRQILDGRAPDLLTSVEHRLKLFERMGVQFAWVLDFTPELSRMKAAEFAAEFFVGRLGIKGLMLGFDSRFGCDRMGSDSPELPPMARSLGFDVRCLKPVLTPNGEPISSTLIREAIWEGRLRDAEAMLGRRVSVYGTVIHGEARGRRLGYRTANVDLGREIRPPFGVYATLAELDGERFGSVSNVGYRPTVSKDATPGAKPDLLIETHIFDFDRDIYGQKMEVHFVEKLRDERRFPDVQALADQIRRDEAKARGILRALGVAV